MAILVHILTILFGFVTFVIVRDKRYKDVPFVSFIMIFSFAGFGMVSLLMIFNPLGQLLLFPLVCIVFGLIIIFMLIHDFYLLIRCKEKINATYCGYNSYYGTNGMSRQAPVFAYTYQNRLYKEQTTQSVSYKKLTNNMCEGKVYPIYVDPKYPAVFIFEKKLSLNMIILVFFGILFLVGGLITLSEVFPYFLNG